MTAALDGITVVDLTQAVSGPFTTRLLAQMGARVIKVERPGTGDLIRMWDTIVQGQCSGHAWVNPGKESVALDLKTDEGRALLAKLVERADVVIENFVPGTLESFGFSYEKFKALKPDVILCRISGFGQTGPYRDRAAMDLIIQGEAGLVLTNGTPDTPAKISVSICDITTAFYATMSILQALYHRRGTGRGQEVKVSMLESTLTLTGYFPYMYWYANQLPERVGLHHHTIAPYGPYECRDGRSVIIIGGGAGAARWKKFCEAIGRPDMFENPKFGSNQLRIANRPELDGQICAEISKRDRAFWLEHFHAHDVPCGALNDMGEALEHPVVKARGFVKELPSATGPIKSFDFPPIFSELQAVNEKGPPVLGEHTAKVLAELGLDAAGIEALRAAGVVECAKASEAPK